MNSPGGRLCGKLNSMPSTGLCLLTDFPLPDSLRMSVTAEATTLREWIASRRDSPALTSPTWGSAALADSKDSTALPLGSSFKSFVSSKKFNPLGWCWKTSQRCSLQTIAKTLRSSSGSLPSAGMWDSGGCLTLNISESPSAVAEFSWSRVLDATPAPSSWLMPRLWNQYLARCLRAQSHGLRTHGLALPLRLRTPLHASIWVLKFSWLKRTDGIRWLSGNEALRYTGFPSDWMMIIGRWHLQPGMPSVRQLLNGSRKS